MMKIYLSDFFFSQVDEFVFHQQPWLCIADLPDIILRLRGSLGASFQEIEENVWVHASVTVEKGAILKGPIIIEENCFIAAHAYLRNGVYLSNNCIVGPGVELKTSWVGAKTSFGHFNYIGDSLVGSGVNFEAGAVIANHFNERENKEIWVNFRGNRINTQLNKFGSIIGDHTKVGANAVLAPGTILAPHSIVDRLEYVKPTEPLDSMS